MCGRYTPDFCPPSKQKCTDVRRICLHSSGRGFVSISISIGETEKQCFERETSLFMCASLWLAWPPDMISPCSGSQPDVIDIHKCLKFASKCVLYPDRYYDMNESHGIRFKVRWDQRATGCELCLIVIKLCVSEFPVASLILAYVHMQKGCFVSLWTCSALVKVCSVYLLMHILFACKDVNCALFISLVSMEVWV